MNHELPVHRKALFVVRNFMRQLLLLIFILTQNASFGQLSKALESVWYAKHLSYQFPQDGSAKIFTKKIIPSYTERLEIDSLGNYVFIQRNKTNVDTFYGKVYMLGDTLIFDRKVNNNEQYIIYSLTDDNLIYSNKRISTQAKDEPNNKIFSPVETPSQYKFGKDSLLSLIYREVSSSDPDSVHLNTYKFVVDAVGMAKPGTVVRVKGDQDFLSQLKGIIEKHYTEFIPATQNGRAVTSQLTITFSL